MIIDAVLSVLAEQWRIAAGITLVLFMFYCGGPWSFLVRVFATMAAVCMAASSFCRLMDHATRHLLGKSLDSICEFAGMSGEALVQAWKEARKNRRAALEEMGERA